MLTISDRVPADVVVAVIAVVAVAMLVRAVIGFGDALLAMPLLTLLIGVRSAVPVMAALSVTVAAVILLRAGRASLTREAIGLLAGAVPGVPVGVLLLRAVPETVLAGMLGAAVALYGAWRLASPPHHVTGSVDPSRPARPGTTGAPPIPPDTTGRPPPTRPDARARRAPRTLGRGRRLVPLVGFAAGAFGTATGAGGPPVVVYGVARGWRPDHFRATLQTYFLGSSLFAFAGYAAAGLWTPTTLGLFAAALPGVLLAVVAGWWIAGRVPAARFARLVALALVGLGASLLAVALR